MKEKLEVNKGFIIILDEEGKVVEMPMVSLDSKVRDVVPEKILDDYRNYIKSKNPNWEVIIN